MLEAAKSKPRHAACRSPVGGEQREAAGSEPEPGPHRPAERPMAGVRGRRCLELPIAVAASHTGPRGPGTGARAPAEPGLGFISFSHVAVSMGTGGQRWHRTAERERPPPHRVPSCFFRCRSRTPVICLHSDTRVSSLVSLTTEHETEAGPQGVGLGRKEVGPRDPVKAAAGTARGCGHCQALVTSVSEPTAWRGRRGHLSAAPAHLRRGRRASWHPWPCGCRRGAGCPRAHSQRSRAPEEGLAAVPAHSWPMPTGGGGC